MSLKTIVKVGSITNLSDARYCSGMGVDMLGFRVVEGQANYISPKQFHEIRGWVVGPKIVAEVYGIRNPTELTQVLEDYRPDYLEMGMDEVNHLGSELRLPLILSLESDESSPLNNITPEFILVSEPAKANTDMLSAILLQINSRSLVDVVLNSTNIKGISMNGSQEIKPGLKDYDVLSEILESLESED